MKKLKFLAVLSLLVVSIFTLVGCDENTTKNQIHISSKEDLLLLQNGGNFILDNDIDCEGLNFKAIQGFKGEIDGNGHKIHNVTFISDNNCIGFIGTINNSDKSNEDVTIKNLAITDFKIDTNLAARDNTLYVGGLLALNWYSDHNWGHVTIENCYVDGNINIDVNSKDIHVGGLIGFNTRSMEIRNCMSNVNIICSVNNGLFSSSSLNIGGLVGESYNYRGYYPEIENSLFTGSIDIKTTLTSSLGATVRVGGILGYGDGYNYINYCLATPKKIICDTYFDRNVYMGGLVGLLYEWNECVNYSYWCNYYDESLSEEERELKCSQYKGHLYYYGTNVKLSKTDMLQEGFMKGDYTFTDLDGNIKDSFLKFNPEVWKFGYFDNNNFIYPSLKVFDGGTN